MHSNKKLSPLEKLPQDLLGEILSKVAKYGRQNVRHCMQVSHELAIASQDDRVSKNLNLRPIAMNPLAPVNNYQSLMEKCLESKNPEAHYIKGIIEYFYNNNTNTGIHHLQASAEGSYKDGIYLYGILMLCRGQLEEGKKYLDKLGWKKSTRRAYRCWSNNKRSLQGIPIIKKPCYFQTLRDNRPNQLCKLNDMDTRCKKCYYYKQMKKFIDQNQNTI